MITRAIFSPIFLQSRECEHLRQIIKELSQSRAKVQKTKVELEEQYVALQKEYVRCVHWVGVERTCSTHVCAGVEDVTITHAWAHPAALHEGVYKVRQKCREVHRVWG